MEACVGPHTYIIFTLILSSCAYGIYAFEPHSISAKFIASIFALAGLYFAQKLIPRGRFKPEGKVVFITGCDTGLGHALALRCDEIGLRVFAGCLLPAGADARTLSSKSSRRLTVVPCDVRSDEQVLAARNLVAETVVKENLVFWACINNAGVQRYGEIEMLPLKWFKEMMEVNTFGMVRVTKAFIPMIRQSKGRFVNMTSVMARWCNSVNSAYCMTKSSADVFNDVLRYEMHKWGVKVSIIQPGPYGGTTKIISFLGNEKERADFMWNLMDDATKRLYGRAYIDKIQEGMHYHSLNECYRDNSPVIDAMVDAILSKSPKHRYVIGGLLAPASWKEFLRYNLLPTWLSDIKMIKQQEALGLPAGLKERKKDN